jgi:uncharacterized membrane protein YagU involved in acid resistance
MTCSKSTSAIVAGAAAGFAGTIAMMALRSFDLRYASKTIPKTREDPGKFMVQQAERAAHLARSVPKSAEKAAVISTHIGYGIVPGILYAMLRGNRRNASSLVEGAAIGTAVYLLGYFGWLPLLGLTRPLWKQPFPEIAGEGMRHVAYGVTTAAVYGAINAGINERETSEALR